MDAFFAAVEQRDNPEYRGKPIIVGGSPESRGVVATASYEARKFGIRSAMPTSQAYRLCPQGIFVYPRFEAYREASIEFLDVLKEYSDLIEPLSLDEAYVDVTENKKNIKYASVVAKEVRQKVFEKTKLTVSAGVAPNKFLAKIASDMNKPNGLTVITPEQVPSFLEDLPIRKIPGIGSKTEEKMHRSKIFKVRDLQEWSHEQLTDTFGKSGNWYYNISRGIDERSVQNSRVRKSVGHEDTFASDIEDVSEMKQKLEQIAEQLEKRLVKRDFRGRTITLKITYSDFTKITRSHSIEDYISDKETLTSVSFSLLEQTEVAIRPVRLLGISVSNLEHVDRLKEEKIKEIKKPSGPEQLTFPFIV